MSGMEKHLMSQKTSSSEKPPRQGNPSIQPVQRPFTAWNMLEEYRKIARDQARSISKSVYDLDITPEVFEIFTRVRRASSASLPSQSSGRNSFTML
jgi:hypothetical protein